MNSSEAMVCLLTAEVGRIVASFRLGRRFAASEVEDAPRAEPSLAGVFFVYGILGLDDGGAVGRFCFVIDPARDSVARPIGRLPESKRREFKEKLLAANREGWELIKGDGPDTEKV
jgi:hypothetical protein